jgi:FixJ family two-component response regulator
MPLRIAVVDDEDSVRKALHRLLTTAGFDVHAFASGGDFLEHGADRVDCALVDLHLPEMDGLEIAERAARLAPALPVILLTGHDKPEYRARAEALGVRSFLSKPVTAQVLFEAIRAATQEGRQRKSSTGGR